MGGRPYPPDFDGYGYPRVMVATAANGNGRGALQLIDVKHDTVYNLEDTVHSYTIGGYTATDPLTIQDFPGQQLAYIFATGGSATGASSFQPVNTGTDNSGTPVTGIAPGTASAYVTGDFQYVYSVSAVVTHSSAGYLTVLRTSDGSQGTIPLASANKLAPSPGAAATSANLLIFAANANSGSNDVYQLVGVGQNPIYQCTQQILPTIAFDKPINALYSSDGTSAFIFNCGPECGGTTASVSIVSTAALAAAAAPAFQQKLGCNIDPSYTPPPVTLPVQNVPVPGGVTDAIQLGTTLFVTGQALYPSGEFGGFLTAIDLSKKTPTTATYVIGDGTHLRMRIGDGGAAGVSNTIWIAAGGPSGSGCSDGEQASLPAGITGCVTMVPITQNGTGYTVAGTCNTASPAPIFAGAQSCSSIVIEPSHGSAGGVAPITGYKKTYSVEGNGVYIYSTVDGSSLYNLNVQVGGYPNDIAFIDGTTNTGP